MLEDLIWYKCNIHVMYATLAFEYVIEVHFRITTRGESHE